MEQKKTPAKNTLQGTNISPKNGNLKMIFPFPKVGYVNSLEGTRFFGGCPHVFFFWFPMQTGTLTLNEHGSLKLDPQTGALCLGHGDFSIGFFPWQHLIGCFGGLVEPILNFETFQVTWCSTFFFGSKIFSSLGKLYGPI